MLATNEECEAMTSLAIEAVDNAARIERYRRDGFLHVPGLFSPAEIARHRAAVDEAVAARSVNDYRSLEEKTPYEQSFIQCTYLWEDFPKVRALTFEPRITSLAAALLGVPAIRIWHDQALYKEAGGRETDAHQDHAYWPIAEFDAITAWIALVDVTHETGCMGYVAGTQDGDCEYIDIFRKPGSGKDLEAKHASPTWIPCKAGDVIFHAARTVHLAKPNRTDDTRRVHTAIYFADGCTRAAKGDHPSVSRNRVAPGEKIAGPATPMAWPLDGGTLPEPTSWAEFAASYKPGFASGVFPKI
jgi:ectoine hydroxylase-related dioxygenase (phytanoyl-CoA dioxygenase family)